MGSSFNSSKILSASFSERITRESKRPREVLQDYSASERWVLFALLIVFFVLFGLARLIELQVVSGAYYKSLAEGNRIRRVPIRAARGEVFDRNGVALARNVPVYKLATFSPGGVVSQTQEITREEAFRIQAQDTELAGRILIEVGREYPLSEHAAHLVGYVNEVSADEVGKPPDCAEKSLKAQVSYQIGDLIGRMGIEAYYECELRGINGEEIIEVDARGKLVRRLGRREPIPGKSMNLTIDAGLQEEASRALFDAPSEEGRGLGETSGVILGALVVQMVNSGEILALVSSPSFEPTKIREKYAEYVQDENQPFFNRAVSGVYPPGSTYKLVTAVAGVEEGKIDRNYTYKDTGLIQVGSFAYRNWYYTQYGRTEGEINLTRAITRSTDTFFYKVGEYVGVEKLVEWSRKFKLGEKTGVDLPGEVTGLVPTPEWKEQMRGERWFLGNTYHMSIGQGDLLVTPLQINAITATLAGGSYCTPHLTEASRECKVLELASDTVNLIKEGMVGACSPEGTAYPLFGFDPQIACKTGTAQYRGNKSHAWLTAFAPATESAQVKPEIAVTALVEGGGEGSRVAAPVVKRVLEKWFNNNYPR